MYDIFYLTVQLVTCRVLIHRRVVDTYVAKVGLNRNLPFGNLRGRLAKFRSLVLSVGLALSYEMYGFVAGSGCYFKDMRLSKLVHEMMVMCNTTTLCLECK